MRVANAAHTSRPWRIHELTAIRPFRHLLVYPPLLREIGRTWQR